MKKCFGLFLSVAMCLSPVAAAADRQVLEKVVTYDITGKTGAELYASIGVNGPLTGGLRSLAHTTFTLTWTRKYEPQQDDSCALVAARPRLTIIYTLPRPAGKLPPAAARSWEAFIAGVRDHEKVHGDFIRDMVKEIEHVSIGLSVAADPGCKRIRTELTKRLAELSLAQRRRSRDFDRAELADGGNMHQLILRLVNGP